MVESTRSILNQFIPDIYIYTDVAKGKESGKSAGYNLSLVAETTNGFFYHSELHGKPNEVPEDLAISVSKRLLSKINNGGCIDADEQMMILLMIALGPEDVFKVKLSSLTENTKHYLEDLKIFFGCNFRIKPSGGQDTTVIVTGLGTGFVNFGKRTH